MKDYKRIEHMRNLNDSLIWECMKRCYDFGYEDGKADTPFTDHEAKEYETTGRCFSDSEIAEILAELRGAENDK